VGNDGVTGGAKFTSSITNVTAGQLTATSTDAVNGSQLYATNQTLSNAVLYTDGTHSSVTLGGGVTPVKLTNAAAGVLSTSSTDAVNGSQLYATNQAVSNAVMYTDATHASVTFGDGVTPVKLSNVAVGTQATDAVNLSQLTSAVTSGMSQVSAMAVNYDAADMANVTLGGANGTAIHNVAAGQLSASSTDAVNGSQLNATNQAVSTLGTTVSNAVMYTDATHASVTLGGGVTPVKLTNVAAGTQATDAVNFSQLSSGMSQVSAMALNYDAADMANATLGGTNGTTIHNLAAGVANTDAVNMGQLNTLGNSLNSSINTLTTLENRDALAISTLNGTMTTLQQSGGMMPNTIAVDGSGSASVQANSGDVAIGNSATTGGAMGTAIGGSSFAAGPNDTALGGNAKVNADGSTAVGANTVIAATATNAVAVGESASVTAPSGTAIGQGSSVTAANAVALGQGSVADVANTVSVGSATNQRQITNVAAGVNTTDAANVGQVNTALAAAKTYTDVNAQQTLSTANAYTNSQLGNVQNHINDQFQQVDKRINEDGAMSAASTQMAINAAGATGNGRLAAGVGEQSGRSAISVGYAAPLGNRMHVSVGATASGSQTSVGAGFGVDL
jgi:autotransporter adhesin